MASWHNTAKPFISTRQVNQAVVWRRSASLSGEIYREANVRKLFNRLDRWVVRRIWSHRRKRWRNCGWKELPEPRLYRELGLVNLVSLIGGIHERGQAPKLL